MGETSKLPKLDKQEWILALDPGASGGIARFWGSGLVEVWAMPDGEQAIASFLFDLFDGLKGTCRGIVLEKVWGRKSDSTRSATTFMTHYGFLRGVLVLCGMISEVPLIDVLPTEWQRALGVPKTSRDMSITASKRKTQHKNALKLLALGLFPDLKVTLRTCDALLIGEYGRKYLCA